MSTHVLKDGITVDTVEGVPAERVVEMFCTHIHRFLTLGIESLQFANSIKVKLLPINGYTLF